MTPNQTLSSDAVKACERKWTVCAGCGTDPVTSLRRARISAGLGVRLESLTYVDWLLGLSRVSWDDGRAELSWRFEMPAWVWVFLILMALTAAGWSYSRLLGPTAGRFVCASVRALLIILVAALIAGPTLVMPHEHVEPDHLLLLVDRSASLRIRDAVDKQSASAISRDTSLREALAQHEDLFGPQGLGRERQMVWLGFGGNTFQLRPPTEDIEALGAPEAPMTAIRTAIEQALQRSAGRPISGIVLFSDGRTPQSTGADLVRLLQQEAISVFCVPLGAAAAPLDLAIARIDAPERALVDDTVPVTVFLDRYPDNAQVDPARIRVRLIDSQTDKVLDQRTAEGQTFDPHRPVRLSGRSAIAGPVTWEVELVYETMETSGQELITENNVRRINLDLIDRPIRVLYIEGYPRWEYRYLKNVLIREQSILSSIMLISADRDFLQEGDVPITRLPISSEELQPYDVVIIGEVPSSYLSVEQMQMLRDHVSARGAGLIWIGGSSYTPRTYEATPLADLLPMRQPALVQRFDPTAGPLAMTPTPLADSLHVLRLRSDTPRASEDTLWPERLPPLWWAQDLGSLKPTAEVLAFAPIEGGKNLLPLLVRLRYGAGQSLYLASDETWRWRLGRGDIYFDQFWMQLVQMLVRGRLQQLSDQMWLEVSHRRIEHGQPVVLKLRVDNAQFLERELSSVSVGVYRADDASGNVLDRIELRPMSEAGFDGAGTGGHYGVIWHPNALLDTTASELGGARAQDLCGTLLLRVIEPALVDLDITEHVELIAPGDELRHPAADHDRLAALAEQSGGEVVPLDELDKLATLIPNRARRTPSDFSEPLWDSPLALVLVVFLLIIEWVSRKVIRLA